MKNYITLLLVLVIVFCQPIAVFAEINNQNTSNRHERIIQEDFINQQIILNDTSKLEKKSKKSPIPFPMIH